MNKEETKKKSIIIIGAGGIVQNAHLPAYALANYNVKGIFDINKSNAEKATTIFNIPIVYNSLSHAIKEMDKNTVVDIAVPTTETLPILKKLPDGTTVLIQKPMGENLFEARKILATCHKKKLRAGVNFQLRYAPFIIKAKEMIQQGLIGDICDVEINVNVHTPWHLWKFLFDIPRVEILYHSIHYIDLVRSLLGNPEAIFSKTVKYPGLDSLASVKSNIIMDYGDMKSASVLTNHCHIFGTKHQQSYLKLEGTKGAIKIKMGLLMNYPNGVPDEFEFIQLENGKPPQWDIVPIEGSWFPHAFIGSMKEMITALNDKNYIPDNTVEDCIDTMICVEEAYKANNRRGIKIKFEK